MQTLYRAVYTYFPSSLTHAHHTRSHNKINKTNKSTKHHQAMQNAFEIAKTTIGTISWVWVDIVEDEYAHASQFPGLDMRGVAAMSGATGAETTFPAMAISRASDDDGEGGVGERGLGHMGQPFLQAEDHTFVFPGDVTDAEAAGRFVESFLAGAIKAGRVSEMRPTKEETAAMASGGVAALVWEGLDKDVADTGAYAAAKSFLLFVHNAYSNIQFEGELAEIAGVMGEARVTSVQVRRDAESDMGRDTDRDGETWRIIERDMGESV